jgi:two-component system sensor histidine kinase DevS
MPAHELGAEMRPGVGVAGAVLHTRRPIRLDRYGDVEQPTLPEFADHALIGVPIWWGDEMIGFFGIGAPPPICFDDADVETLALFARHAAIAIDNARLHAQARLLAVAEERDRIGRDLHDGIIQSLYAVGLSLEDVPDIMIEAPDEAAGRVDSAIESINLAIRDIRNFIYGLRPEAVDGSQLLAGVAALAEELRHGGLIDVSVVLDPAADPRLTPEAGNELLNLVREALSNAARHSRARRISVALQPSGEGPILIVEDDGTGFDPNSPRAAGHHGIGNMRARAAAIGAEFAIYSAPESGTRIVLRLQPPTGAS